MELRLELLLQAAQAIQDPERKKRETEAVMAQYHARMLSLEEARRLEQRAEEARELA